MGRYISTTGTASSVIRNVSTTFTATVNDRILANSSGGAFTITFPLSTSLLVNDVIQVVDVTGILIQTMLPARSKNPNQLRTCTHINNIRYFYIHWTQLTVG